MKRRADVRVVGLFGAGVISAIGCNLISGVPTNSILSDTTTTATSSGGGGAGGMAATTTTSSSGGGGAGGMATTTATSSGGGGSGGAPATCDDHLKNGSETDVDCGGSPACGPGCPGCDNGLACAKDTDCISGHCAVDHCDVGSLVLPGGGTNHAVFKAVADPCNNVIITASLPGGARVLKYGPDLALSWPAPFILGNSLSVAVDEASNVYVTGNITSMAVLPMCDAPVPAIGITDQSIFVAKLDPMDGHCKWLIPIVHSIPGVIDAPAIAATPAGDVYVTSGFDSTSIDFGGALTLGRASPTHDVFVARILTAGTVKWAKGFGPVATDAGVGSVSIYGSDSIAAVSDSTSPPGDPDVVITGSLAGTVDFAGIMLSANTAVYALRLKYETGERRWVHVRPPNDGCFYNSQSVASDQKDGVWLAATCSPTMRLYHFPKTFVQGQEPDSVQAALVDQKAQAIAVDPQGNVLIAGSNINFFQNILLTKVHPGNPPSAITIPFGPSAGAVPGHAPALAVSANGNVILSGSAQSKHLNGGGVSLDLDPNDAFSADDYKAFILSLGRLP